MDIVADELLNIRINLDADYSSVFYLLKIKGTNKYKYGITDNIKRRISEHSRNFDHDIIGIWKCSSRDVTILLENKIKEFVKENKISSEHKIQFKNETEIFIPNDNISIDFMYKLIDKFSYDSETLFKQKFLKNITT